ncbi:hypothetical protein KIM67_09860 [Flagellimonas sp. 389]|uniref:sensor histidine kinase n=1 Tax=Flagellimonas sp. 389 TaxID=2835862 RepID=UPI001BD41C37|nr:histidine kinase [Flagellimonas sp. 389]MBS9462717.1 hypothetical protein [Flagellimonas sp. 389]
MSALKYISKFGSPTRSVLENSIETKVLLRDEIKLLNSYLELESLRFDNVFEYKINVSEDLDTNTTEIPFMAIQPFIENAIIHGLNNKKEGDKKLLISFKKKGDVIVCFIEDNGIGRIASRKLNNTLKKKKKSRGIEIIEKRLKLIGKPYPQKGVIEIIDKYDDNNNSTGTRVSIKIGPS